MEEMQGIAAGAKPLEGRALERADRALSFIQSRDTVAESDIRAEFANYFEAVA